MKKTAKIVTIITLVLVLSLSFALLTACNNGKNDKGETPSTENDNTNESSLSASPYRFTAPEGTPALAILRLTTDNKKIAGHSMEYEIVKPANIAAEMSSGKSDLVIMPVNAGSNLIRSGADYKLVSIAVNGSLFMMGIGESNTITFDDIKGKKIACIGQTGVPGLVFRYVMKKNGINLITEGTPNAENNEVFVQYVADGAQAKQLFASNEVQYAVVGEPAATAMFKTKLNCNAEMNMQEAYAACSDEGITDYPQAGLFVKSSIASNETFMTALFSALKASKDWVVENKTEVTAFADENLYEGAAFPAPSIARCALNAATLSENEKVEVIAFLKAVMPKDSNGNVIDWDSVKGKLF